MRRLFTALAAACFLCASLAQAATAESSGYRRGAAAQAGAGTDPSGGQLSKLDVLRERGGTDPRIANREDSLAAEPMRGLSTTSLMIIGMFGIGFVVIRRSGR